MKLHGQHVVCATREKVWGYLNDPEVLAAATPGCQRLEAAGPDEYNGVFNLGVGPVKGRYEGKISLKNKRPPEAYTLVIEADSPGGFVHGIADLRLEEVDAGRTRIVFDGEAQLGGMIAGVGQRVLEGVGKFLTGQFFAAFQREVEKRR